MTLGRKSDATGEKKRWRRWQRL
uniref:Uncharacterized protein n=1 Tax=Rhizophora mucronata TaxID=61149 RepID=A0A2P2Q2D6_RHIMU